MWRMALKSKSVIGKTKWCSICGLKIPNRVVSSDHPLYGTIDHVLPLSKGGTDTFANRAPAHRVCNSRKGNSVMVPLDHVRMLQSKVAVHLNRLGIPTGPPELRQARLRVNVPPPRSTPLGGLPIMLARWEDDGGAPASY